MDNTCPKYGLVLEGGAMRGMFTAGVIDVFIDNDIKFDGAIGVSAGAVIGINYPSKQKGRAIGYTLDFIKDKRYMGIGNLIKTGDLIGKDFAYYTVPVKYYPFDEETFHKTGIPFYAAVTNMETGDAEYFEIEDFDFGMEALRASASLPFVTKPVMLNGKPYLDGGVADSIPYRKMFELGYDKLVVVLTRDGSYRKSPMPAFPTRYVYRKYPAFADRIMDRHNEYNSTVRELEKLESEGRVFIIRPPAPLGIGRTERNLEKIKRTYEKGLAQGEARLGALKEFLSGKSV
ncbi:MAG: patatin family protein [Clostridia bacterium]|nr:patatin family protein [Clostridia bacterium]